VINHSLIKKALTIRAVENKFLELFSLGKLNGTVHTKNSLPWLLPVNWKRGILYFQIIAVMDIIWHLPMINVVYLQN